MGTPRQNDKRQTAGTQVYSSRRSNIFLPRLAIALSTLAIIFSTLTLAQVFTLQRAVKSLEDSMNRLTTVPSPTPTTVPNTTNSDIPTPPPVVAPYSTITPSPTPTLQPGKFVQSALSNQGQVELLRVNRIPSQFDVVNVQMRIRALKPNIPMSEYIDLNDTIARNPATGETYKAISGESTGAVSLGAMQSANQSQVDAYVWLQVPTEINAIDIYIPNTEPFQNVPISS